MSFIPSSVWLGTQSMGSEDPRHEWAKGVPSGRVASSLLITPCDHASHGNKCIKH